MSDPRAITFRRPRAPSALGVGLALLAAVACTRTRAPVAVAPRTAARAAAASAPPASARAQLVVSVVIDQLGSDTLHRLEPLLAPDGAVAYARAHGRVFEQAVYAYAATLTAPGHAALYSGAAPEQSGIATNYVVDRRSGARRGVVDDGTHEVLGAAGEHAGPEVLRVDTVADVLKAATGGRARVVSLSLKDRSAILPAGQHPDLVLWYAAAARGFTTSTYYAGQLPPWLTGYEHVHPIAPEAVSWQVSDPERLARLLGPDAAPGEGSYKGLGPSFPHRFADTPRPYELWPLAPDSAEYMLELAYAAAQQLELGRDDVPDLLELSISGTDYDGHVFGPSSWEYADHLRRADRALMRLVQRLQAQTRVAVLITSDHGVAPLPEQSHAAHPSATRIDADALAQALDHAVDAAIGPGNWVLGYVEPYVFLSQAAREHPQHARIRALVKGALAAWPGVARAVDCEDLEALRGDPDPVAQRVLRSIHPATSGDFFVVVAPYAVPEIGMAKGAGTTHGSPWDYDTHVPVLMFGSGVAPGAASTEQVDTRRVASTLAALLGVPPPAQARLPPLPGVAAPR